MDYDREKVEEVVMALLNLTLREERGGARAWKGYDWDVMNSLHERGWIYDPKGKAKSVVLTEEGITRCRELFRKHFGTVSASDVDNRS